ncbi:MAG TPA: hypothetical protein VGJ75_11130 [Dongiaceae bacterium]|jgi:hypothetical protein
MPEIADCLARNHRRYQFAPVWSEGLSGRGARDFAVHRSDGRITGCLALWDQSRARQAVIRGYHPRIAALRPALNLLGRVTGLPHLPRPGQPLRQVYLSLMAVDGDDPTVLVELVKRGLAEAAHRGFDLALIGLADSNPMLPMLRRSFRAREYRSLLYLVHWEDGRDAVESLGQRPLHVEAGLL